MNEITVGHYLILSAIIFVIGIVGIFLNRKNIIIILMSIELMLLAVNINLVSFSIYLQDLTGQIFTMFILTVAAAEAAIGLAIIVIYYKNKGSINVENINNDKNAEIPTNELDKIWQFLSPSLFPKKPEINELNKGRKTIAYSISTLQRTNLLNID